MFDRIGIVARIDRKEALGLVERLAKHLEANGRSVYLESNLSKLTNRKGSGLSLEEMEVDLIITVGGDGTVLKTCLLIPKPEPPILAINMGVRGFLTEVMPEESIDAIGKCFKGEFLVEHCPKIASFIGGTRLPDALNEVFVTADAPVKLLHASIWKENMLLAECRADGIMVASQVGSTGYSLSAGGPVLDPEVEAFVLIPVCPLVMFYPMVFSAKSKIGIETFRPRKTVVVLDGHYRREVESKNCRITITKSEYESSFIRFKGGFYQRLKGRLLFSGG